MNGLLCGLKCNENGVDPRLLEVAPVDTLELVFHLSKRLDSKDCLTQRGTVIREWTTLSKLELCSQCCTYQLWYQLACFSPNRSAQYLIHCFVGGPMVVESAVFLDSV
jgi:hypothetical protein